MLPLDSARWSELDCFHRNPENIPNRLAEGTNDVSIYDDLLTEVLFFQGTVYSSFYAALPHIVKGLASLPIAERREVLCQIGYVLPFASFRNAPQVPDHLRPAYEAAIDQVPQMICESILLETEQYWLRHLLAGLAAAKRCNELSLVIANLDRGITCQRCDQVLICPSCGGQDWGRLEDGLNPT
jgi:hypothetical protein